MAYLEKELEIKKSKIPGAGKGLFTKKFIGKGARIVEYKGRVTTWKDIRQNKVFNGYVYYINSKRVIDAKGRIKTFGRYANDARGITRIKGMLNNSIYVEDKGKVYIEATKDIPPGSEILVAYGKDYWDVIRKNNKIDEKENIQRKKAVKRISAGKAKKINNSKR